MNRLDFLGLMDEVFLLMKGAWGQDAPVFTMLKPDGTDSRNVRMPQIVYTLEDAKPGLVGNDSTREIRRRHRGTVLEESITGEKVSVSYYGQIQDCTVSFTIYATSNEEAFYWTEKLRTLLLENKQYLLQKGVANIWWMQEREHSTRESGKAYTASRQLRYLVRLDDVQRVEHVSLEQVNLTIQTTRQALQKEGVLPSQQVRDFRVASHQTPATPYETQSN